ncbi:MAG: DUF86 domain-containing protein [Planctomycetes bacterium]|nr:DUF86 domain-containing protein [Planctomycetota bacterium]
MPPEAQVLLADVRKAALALLAFSKGRTLPEFLADEMLRSAVERKFEIIGEALTQLAKVDPVLADSVPERKRIVAFRNILAHSYARVDPATVWDILEKDVPPLLAWVENSIKPASAP